MPITKLGFAGLAADAEVTRKHYFADFAATESGADISSAKGGIRIRAPL